MHATLPSDLPLCFVLMYLVEHIEDIHNDERCAGHQLAVDVFCSLARAISSLNINTYAP